MASFLRIEPLRPRDIAAVRPGRVPRTSLLAPVTLPSIAIPTDICSGWDGSVGKPIGYIAAVRCSAAYGFIRLFIVVPGQRGRSLGKQLWRHALNHLKDLPCIGLEAATDRVDDYSRWGFKTASLTQRWQWLAGADTASSLDFHLARLSVTMPLEVGGFRLLRGNEIPAQAYDALREPSPHRHFLAD